MYPLTSPTIATIAAEQLREERERAAQARLVREIRLSGRSAARPAVRTAAGRSLRRYLRPRVSRAAA
jgi:hypothetical protein